MQTAGATEANGAPPPVSDITQAINNLSSYIPDSWQPYWEQIQSIPMLAFIVTVGLGYVLAKIAVMVFTKSLSQITKRTKSDVDDQLIATLKKPFFLTIFFFFLGVAVKTVGLSAGLEGGLIRILASLLVISWMMRGFKVLHLLLDTLSRNRARFEIIQPKTIPLFELVGKILLIGLGSYILLIIWGINPTAWLASAGVIGIAVGFAAKDTLANLFSGFFIIADTPYKVGDFVNLDSGERGMVTHVGMRSTRLLTRDDVEITIPNNVIGNAKIINESSGRWEKSRIRIKVGAAYGSDSKQVCDVLMAVANQHDEVVKEPAARVRFRSFGASSLDFELLVWIAQPVLRGRISHELHMQVYDAFNQAGIEIPYAKQDLYIKEFPSNKV
ncbi:mechanosensitive ion channel family protein [Marinicella sp. S1101]|uniref:mechanosensitive ion channel family protein n=1 Tax=Marinicella marina TaxID=2996016 RepID=UPI00226084B0|nr:mechanosensitive ion channel family protein [Marinicella marina]MCX7552716.1 mechanosensitive ion channel family protein [Marinicella marina]MDJ1139975.1 mechanosensitive ion channel family protein [Marinicella marina]